MNRHGPTPQRRLDVDPLVRFIERLHGYPDDPKSAEQVRPGRLRTDVDIGRILGGGAKAIRRWRAGGGVPLHIADRIARDLGTHLLLIWPDAYNDIDTEEAA